MSCYSQLDDPIFSPPPHLFVLEVALPLCIGFLPAVQHIEHVSCQKGSLTQEQSRLLKAVLFELDELIEQALDLSPLKGSSLFASSG